MLLGQTSETTNLERLNKLKGRNTTKMNKVENTPLEKRNKEHYEKLCRLKGIRKGYTEQEVHASTPAETRCIRNDKDQLRQHSGWKRKVKNMSFAI